MSLRGQQTATGGMDDAWYLDVGMSYCVEREGSEGGR